VLAAGIAAPAADAARLPTPLITGGATVSSPAEAPWSVLLNMTTATGFDACSGSIIDATHVLTAAHCTYNEAGEPFPLSSYTVDAGISEDGPVAQPSVRARHVSAVRVEPNFRPGQVADDVAILTVSQPFDLSGPAVQPIGIVSENSDPPFDATVRSFGWGQDEPGSVDGHEHSLESTLLHQWQCSAGIPSMLCTRSSAGSPCPGDSGSGLVTLGAQPAVFGVDDRILAAECGPGVRSLYTDLGTPEISAWLAGDEDPPQAPTAEAATKLTGDQNAGGTATCTDPPWSGSPVVSTLFVYADTGQIVQQGTSTSYALTSADEGHSLACVSVASNAGGTTEAESETTVTVGPALNPGLSLSVNQDGTYNVGVGAGVVLALRLVFTNAAGNTVKTLTFASNQGIPAPPKLPPGKYTLCLESAPVGIYAVGRVCTVQIFRGDARELLKLVRSRRRGRRWRVLLAGTSGLIGRRVTAIWAVSGCRRCRPRNARITVKPKLGLTSPALPRDRRMALIIRLPEVVIAGTPYEASDFRLTLPALG
jgi:Trypsin